jgi:hypothetical protein
MYIHTVKRSIKQAEDKPSKCAQLRAEVCRTERAERNEKKKRKKEKKKKKKRYVDR